MNDDLKPQSFDLEAWRARMTQTQESEEERLARKAVQRRARELSMSTEALAWFMGLESKIATLEGRLEGHSVILDNLSRMLLEQQARIEDLEHPQPKIWRTGQ